MSTVPLLKLVRHPKWHPPLELGDSTILESTDNEITIVVSTFCVDPIYAPDTFKKSICRCMLTAEGTWEIKNFAEAFYDGSHKRGVDRFHAVYRLMYEQGPYFAKHCTQEDTFVNNDILAKFDYWPSVVQYIEDVTGWSKERAKFAMDFLDEHDSEWRIWDDRVNDFSWTAGYFHDEWILKAIAYNDPSAMKQSKFFREQA